MALLKFGGSDDEGSKTKQDSPVPEDKTKNPKKREDEIDIQ